MWIRSPARFNYQLGLLADGQACHDKATTSLILVGSSATPAELIRRNAGAHGPGEWRVSQNTGRRNSRHRLAALEGTALYAGSTGTAREPALRGARLTPI